MHLYSMVPKVFVEEDLETNAKKSFTSHCIGVAHDSVDSNLRREYSMRVKGRLQRSSLLQFQRTLHSLLEEKALRTQREQQQDEHEETLQHMPEEAEQLSWALEESRRIAQENEAQTGLQEDAYLDEWLNSRPLEPGPALAMASAQSEEADREASPEVEQRLERILRRELELTRDFARDAIEVAPLVATWAAAAATTTASAATLGGAGAATIIVVAAMITTVDG